MKKCFLFLFLSLLILFSFCACAQSFSKSEAEKMIKKEFPLKDKEGYYQIIKADLHNIPESYIYDLAEKGLLVLTKTQSGLFNSNVYSISSDIDCKAKWVNVDLSGHKAHKGEFREVYLFKRYFLGVEKAWRDQRRGYEDDAYALYKTKIVLNDSCYQLIKDSGGTILCLLVPMYYGIEDYAFQDSISISKYMSKMEFGKILIYKKEFSKDSQGNWR